MDIRAARKLKTGAIVREAYRPDSWGHPIHGIVIGKKHIKEKHHAKLLSQWKEERYDIVVHWLCREPLVPCASWKGPIERLQVRESWELMVVSHVTS